MVSFERPEVLDFFRESLFKNRENCIDIATTRSLCMFRAVEPVLESMEILNEFLDDFKLRISLLFAFGRVVEISKGLSVTGVLERVGSN